jgi:hypothetical protein
MTLTITAIEELTSPLDLPAFLPTPARKRARDWLAIAAAELARLEPINQLPGSPAASAAGVARPRPDDASRGAGGAAAVCSSLDRCGQTQPQRSRVPPGDGQAAPGGPLTFKSTC